VRALRSVEYVAPSIGDQLFVHFRDGGIVGLVFAPTHEAAARIAAAAPAPGDPFAYKAVGTAIVSWPGDPDDPHLRPVERCLLKP
jgi:hypothetical protein